MDQSILMTLAVPFSYNLKLLPALPLQKYYVNGPQINLCYPTTNFNSFLKSQGINLQQTYLQEALILQQRQLQRILLSNIAKQDAIASSFIYNPQEELEGQQKTKLEETTCKTGEVSPCSNLNSASYSYSSSTQQNNTITFDYYKDAIIHIMDHFLNHFGKITQDEIERFKMRYSHDTMLIELFDTLVSRYRTANKSREDMVRFVMRKSLTWLRDQTRRRSKMSAKAASVALCHKYFAKDVTDFQNNKRMLDASDDELLSLVLPYKKNSRHPVVNCQFIKEIFSSKEFSQDYLKYLQNYSDIMEQENQKKIRQFNDFLLSCIRENCLHKVANYKRIPWLDVWIESSQTIGYEIYELHASKGDEKRQLLQEKQTKTK